MNEIYFFGENKPNGYLSNFYPVSFEENGILFNCSEQYFMYRKCITFEPNNSQLLQEILQESIPKKVKSLGRQVKNFNENIWNENKYEIMKNALILKFTQNRELLEKLFQTGNSHLYEASPYDRIWGIGYSSRDAPYNRKKYGQNLLGKCLMEVREELKKRRKI